MVVDCVKRPESGRWFDVSLDGVGWWSRGAVRGRAKVLTRYTRRYLLGAVSGRTGRGENVLCSIHGYAMWKLRDRDSPHCGLGGGESPYELPMHNDQLWSKIRGAPILSFSDRATTALLSFLSLKTIISYQI